MKQTLIAMIYDFDGTLSPGNMQEFGFIEAIKKDTKSFWDVNDRLAKNNDADNILCYMWLMLERAKAENIKLCKEEFHRFGQSIQLFKGVIDWFNLINDYGKTIGLEIEHYINSSGLKEMIEGTPIAKEFKKIYACSYLYDKQGEAYWPAVAVNYTTKTQFLFRINKGIESITDNRKINEYVEDELRHIPFRNMIYFGDGETDIPCMNLVKDKGGHSIAVYDKQDNNKKKIINRLIKDKRVNFVCEADYSKNQEMHQIVMTILNKIKADNAFKLLLDKHQAKAFD